MRHLLIIVGVLLLSSCFSAVKIEKTRYQLTCTPSVKTYCSQKGTLVVLKPDTYPLYNTTQMAYRKYPYQMAYFAKNQWADTPSNMLQQLMVQTLQKTHYFHAVITPSFATHYDYILNTQLIDLFQDFTQHPSVVHMTLRAQLVQTRSGRIIRSKQFSVTSVASQNSPAGGVVAANCAAAQMMRKIASFCTRNKQN